MALESPAHRVSLFHHSTSRITLRTKEHLDTSILREEDFWVNRFRHEVVVIEDDEALCQVRNEVEVRFNEVRIECGHVFGREERVLVDVLEAVGKEERGMSDIDAYKGRLRADLPRI